MVRPCVKICCIASVEEAALAISEGADAIGLVGQMPSGPGVIPDELIAEIGELVRPPTGTFLLTSETAPHRIIQHAKRCPTSTIQLVDEVVPEAFPPIRDALPKRTLVQVIHVEGEESIDAAVAVSSLVDAVLLDSGRQNAAVKELGGTGRAHNWQISRQIVEACACQVFLAGGLTSANIGEAIAVVQPFGVDVCSGVRTDGRLDAKKLRDFFEGIANADVSCG